MIEHFYIDVQDKTDLINLSTIEKKTILIL